jgi:hypothetical protein
LGGGDFSLGFGEITLEIRICLHLAVDGLGGHAPGANAGRIMQIAGGPECALFIEFDIDQTNNLGNDCQGFLLGVVQMG